jgi:tetratricopeptide (TPR) repeat protein
MSRLLLISVLAGLALSPDRSATQLTAPDSASACKALVEKEAFAEALVQCREATRNEPVKAPILEAAARAEFEAGEALKAAELYQTVISSSTWKEDTALARAAALWRGSKVLEAEAEFRACLEKTGSAKASQHLISFLIAFGRYAEVPALAREGSKEDPRLCTLSESWGVSEAPQPGFQESACLGAAPGRGFGDARERSPSTALVTRLLA